MRFQKLPLLLGIGSVSNKARRAADSDVIVKRSQMKESPAPLTLLENKIQLPGTEFILDARPRHAEQPITGCKDEERRKECGEIVRKVSKEGETHRNTCETHCKNHGIR